MSANEVTSMVGEALRAMAIGIPGVFLVLMVFYTAIKLTMSKTNKSTAEKDKTEQTQTSGNSDM